MNALSGVDALTSRERDVLALIAAGRTNSEIAAQLGITFETAKWHVSEILSKLPADSREEAAERWRRHNGLAPRFERIFRALTGAVATKWAAGAVAVVVAGAATAAIVAIVINQREEEPDPNSQRSSSHVSATELATSAHATPSVNLGQQTTGVPGRVSLQDKGTGPLPAGIAVYYHADITPTSGPRDLRRAYRDSSGTLRVDSIYDQLPGGGTPVDLAIDPGTARLAARLCMEDDCGSDLDSRTRLITSSDGGITWSDRGVLPVNTVLVGFLKSVLVMMTADSAEVPITRGTAWRVWEFETDRELATFQSPQYQPVVFIGADTIAIRQASGEYLDFSGNLVHAKPALPGYTDVEARTFYAPGGLATSQEFDGNGKQVFYIAEVEKDGGAGRTVVSPIPATPLGWASGDHLIVNSVGLTSPPVNGLALLNVSSGEIIRLAELVSDDEEEILGLGVAIGPFARVNAGGDCLNVRDSASASGVSFACYRDGVLLRDLGETADADGTTWLRVATPDGREGWASAEFLER